MSQGDAARLAAGGLPSLTALTVLLLAASSSPFDQQQPQHGAGQAPLPPPPGAWQSAEAAAQAGLWQPLLALPGLQEVVLGAVHASQHVAFTCSISEHKHQGAARVRVCSPCGGVAGRRFHLEDGAAVSAHICPTESWAELANVQVGVRACGGVQRGAVVLTTLHRQQHRQTACL